MVRRLVVPLLFAAQLAAQTNFPPPPAPANNPHTPQKELLGMALFFEEQLSSTGTVACATCHDFAAGGADPRTFAGVNPGFDNVFGTNDDQHGSPGIGIHLPNGQMLAHPSHGFGPNVTNRRAPTVINSGYHTHLAYDGSKTSLEQLSAAPIMNVVEMGHVGRTWADVAQKLTGATPLFFASNLPPRLQQFVAGRTWPDLFQATYGAPTITQQGIVQALAVYMRTLNSDQTKWDLHLHNQAQLTAQEQLGFQLWNATANGATACATCHGDFDQDVLVEGPIAGQMTAVSTGYYGATIPTRLVFHNIGVRPNIEDPGRQNVSQFLADAGKFRVASLRNVELTAPYFHNGSAATLHDVLDFYDRGGDFHANQAPSLTPRSYTVGQKDALVALLRTLTDPRVAAGIQPFDRPTLGSQNGRLVESIGQGTVGARGRFQANAPYAPRLGEPKFMLTIHGVTPGVPTFVMWDNAASAGGLPFNLELALSPSFQIFTMGPAQSWFTMSSSAGLQVPLPIPNQAALAGQTLFAQWLALEPSTNWPVTTSNALRIPLQ
jgi:cytochrome c peroxidase